MHAHQKRHLPQRGQRCFRFIKDVEPAAAKAVDKSGEKGFPVGLLMQGLAAERVFDGRTSDGKTEFWLFVQLADIGSHMVVALRPQEEAILRPFHSSGNAEKFMQNRVGRAGAEGGSSEFLPPD